MAAYLVGYDADSGAPVYQDEAQRIVSGRPAEPGDVRLPTSDGSEEWVPPSFFQTPAGVEWWNRGYGYQASKLGISREEYALDPHGNNALFAARFPESGNVFLDALRSPVTYMFALPFAAALAGPALATESAAVGLSDAALLEYGGGLVNTTTGAGLATEYGFSSAASGLSATRTVLDTVQRAGSAASTAASAARLVTGSSSTRTTTMPASSNYAIFSGGASDNAGAPSKASNNGATPSRRVGAIDAGAAESPKAPASGLSPDLVRTVAIVGGALLILSWMAKDE